MNHLSKRMAVVRRISATGNVRLTLMDGKTGEPLARALGPPGVSNPRFSLDGNELLSLFYWAYNEGLNAAEEIRPV